MNLSRADGSDFKEINVSRKEYTACGMTMKTTSACINEPRGTMKPGLPFREIYFTRG